MLIPLQVRGVCPWEGRGNKKRTETGRDKKTNSIDSIKCIPYIHSHVEATLSITVEEKEWETRESLW